MFQNTSTFGRISISPEDNLKSTVEIIILVLNRWNDNASRMFIRASLGLHDNDKNTKLIFVFGIPKNISFSEMSQLEKENNLYQDMVVSGTYSFLKLIPYT